MAATAAQSSAAYSSRHSRVGTTGPAIEQIESAKRVCNECEVREPCLEFALESNQDSGVWGGTSEEERRAIRRQRVAARRKAG
jgi:WhiB family redox-sensing transcriptional regulator